MHAELSPLSPATWLLIRAGVVMLALLLALAIGAGLRAAAYLRHAAAHPTAMRKRTYAAPWHAGGRTHF